MGNCTSIAAVTEVERTHLTTRPKNGTEMNNTKVDSVYITSTTGLHHGTNTNAKIETSRPTRQYVDTASNKKVERTQLSIIANGGKHWMQLGGIMNGAQKVKYRDLNCIMSVAISHDGKRVVLGAWAFLGPAKVKVFDFDGTNWKEVGKFSGRKAGFSGRKAGSGRNIALSGDGRWLAIGTELSDGGRGCVEVYKYGKETGWEAMGNKLEGLESYDYFGSSLSFSGNGGRIAIGGTPFKKRGKERCSVKIFDFLEDYEDILKEITQTYAGASDWVSLVMEFLGNGWQQLGPTIVADEIDGYYEALSLSSDGNIVAIGSPGAQYSQCIYPGSVRVFKYKKQKEEWTQVGQTLYGIANHHSFGFTISINAKGDVVAVGAKGRNEHEGGYIQIFCYNSNEWKQMGKTISIECSLNNVSICSNGNRIAVGSSNTAETFGCVEIFDYNGNDWVLQNKHSFDNIFGSSVSLSSSGDQLAVLSLLHKTSCSKVYEF